MNPLLIKTVIESIREDDIKKIPIDIHIDEQFMLLIINAQKLENFVSIEHSVKKNFFSENKFQGVVIKKENGEKKFIDEKDLQNICYQHFSNLEESLKSPVFKEWNDKYQEKVNFQYFDSWKKSQISLKIVPYQDDFKLIGFEQKMNKTNYKKRA